MSQALEIVETNGDYRLDSRLLAQQLGYDHKVLLQSIRRHRARLEARSALLQHEAVLKHQTYRGTTRQTYYLLDERQCLILAGSLKKGSEADEWHDTLVDAFLHARARIRQLEASLQPQQPPTSIHRLTDALRARAMENLGNVPEGYFSVMGELFKHLYNLEAILEQAIDDKAMMEVSVGQLWSTYAREVLHLPDRDRCTYAHRCHNGRIVQAYAYPLFYETAFTKWLWNDYFPDHFPAYQQHRIHRLASASAKQWQRLLQERHAH
jgi:phage regulator Rha-like protein